MGVGGGCVDGGDWSVGGGEVKIRRKVKIDGELGRHLATRGEKKKSVVRLSYLYFLDKTFFSML